MWKRLVDRKGRTYYLNRDQISAVVEVDAIHTMFVVDGQMMHIEISFENAITWLTTAD